jgi:hypothetical protein
MKCPRRNPFFKFPGDSGEDSYINGRCDYCGSLDPETFMQRVEDGTILLGATDKSYKVYVDPAPGSNPLQSIKFYFQHLNETQMRRFVDLFNKQKLKFKGPGESFYVWPFFMQVEP